MTKTLTAAIVKGLTAALAKQDLPEMVQFVKVCEIKKLSTSPLQFHIKIDATICFLSLHVSLRTSSTVLRRSGSNHYSYENAQCVYM